MSELNKGLLRAAEIGEKMLSEEVMSKHVNQNNCLIARSALLKVVDAIRAEASQPANQPNSVVVPELVIKGVSKEQARTMIDDMWGSCLWVANKTYPEDGVIAEYKPAMLRAAKEPTK